MTATGTAGTFGLLGGQLTLLRPPAGHPITEDALWLAAALPRESTTYLEAGTGTGAAALALLSQTPESTLTGVEIDPALATQATANAALNQLAERFNVIQGDIHAHPLPTHFKARHSFANPPFHLRTQGFQTKTARRQQAHGLTEPADLIRWLDFLWQHTQATGSLTLLLHTDLLATALAHAASTGNIRLCWLDSGRTLPTRVILQIQPTVAPPELTAQTLNTADAAIRQSVLRQGAPLWRFTRPSPRTTM